MDEPAPGRRATRRPAVRPRQGFPQLARPRLGALLVAALALLPVGLVAAGAALAQPPAERVDTGGEAAPEAPPSYPPRSEIGPRYAELVDAASEARRRIADLSRHSTAEEELERLAQRQAALGERLEHLLSRPRPNLDELLELRQPLARQSDAVAALVERLAGRLAELDEVRSDWQRRRELWTGWRRELAAAGELGAFAEDFRRSLSLIEQVLVAAEEAVPRFAELQNRGQTLQAEGLERSLRLDAAVATQRSELLSRDAPPLLSAAHRGALAGSGGGAGLAELELPGADFLDRHLWLLLASLALVWVLASLVRVSRRRYGGEDQRWSVLLSHPWALALFVTAALTLPLYAAPPPLWRLLLLAVLAGSACILTRGMFRNPRKRRVVYVLAAALVLLTALETARVPAPAYRLALAALALGGAPYLFLLARGERRRIGGRSGFTAALHAGAAALAAVLGAQLLGYDALSRWLVQASLATAFVIFTAVFLVRLGRGALRAALEQPVEGRWMAARRVGSVLAGRITRLLELLVGVAAGLHVLAVWGVYRTAWEAWGDLAGRGFALGEHRITVGQLVLGAVVVYGAWVTSAVLRTLLDQRLGQRPDLEPGVADSVKTLVHYVLVVLGLFLGIALLGFDLTSFAVVAGALGVGIGFGLQNIVNNFVSGLVLLFERPIRVGDVVVVADQWATVRKIGLRSTIVTTFDRSEMIVPNSDLISEKVTNWTLSDQTTRLLIPVGVAYGSDLERVFRILQETAETDPRIASDPAPVVHFVSFGASSLDFEVRIWVTDITQRLETRSDLLREVDRRFREEGVTVPFPQRDVHLRTADGAGVAKDLAPSSGGDGMDDRGGAGSAGEGEAGEPGRPR